jgi:LmbE family N-acetylglucosaminyl deacetylase
MTVVVCTAHPDDEAIGAGGTIAKLGEQEDVIQVVFSYGQAWPFWKSAREVARARVRETRLVEEILGIKRTFFLGMRDMHFEEDFTEKRGDTLKKIFERYQPTKVFFHSIQDGHPDHRFVNGVVSELISKMDVETYTFEINFWDWLQLRTPKIVFDISETWQRKARALSQFKSQSLIIKILRPLITFKAYYYGRVMGCRYAEVFYKR